ncbi:MAG: hypothetical protein V2A76_00560 [Planctomycetota bacterium]
MKTPITAISLGLLVLCSPQLFARGTHVNETLGYRIKTPQDFEKQAGGVSLGMGFSMRIGADPYVVDSFECTKELPQKSWMDFNQKLQMATFFFPKRSAAEIAKAREEAEKKRGEAGGKKEATITLFDSDQIYLTFEEYAKARIQGFFFEKEKRATVAGFPSVLYEMKFEKLSNTPQRWLACAYTLPGGQFAVLFTCTEGHFDKYESTFKSSFNSFKMLDPAGLNVQPWKSASVTVDLSDQQDEEKMTAEEVLARREKQKQEAYAKCLEELPDGWKHFESEHFLVVYECPPKYAKDVSRQAEGVIAWLGDQFAHVGTGIIQGSILRVYKSQEDIPAGDRIHMTLGGAKGLVREIKFGRPDSRGFQSEFTSLNRSVMENWFRQKNSELWNRMPYWLESGLAEYIEDAEVKDSRLAFGTDEWEKDRWIDAQLAQKKCGDGDPAQAPIKPLKLLLQLTGEELNGGGNWAYTSVQCSSLVRYLLDGPGARNKQTRSILPHYIGHLYDLVEEVEARIEAERNERQRREEAASGMSEEEQLKAEDEEYRKRREQAYDKVAKELLEKSFERTFAGWSDSDWRTFNSSWKYADGKTK